MCGLRDQGRHYTFCVGGSLAQLAGSQGRQVPCHTPCGEAHVQGTEASPNSYMCELRSRSCRPCQASGKTAAQRECHPTRDLEPGLATTPRFLTHESRKLGKILNVWELLSIGVISYIVFDDFLWGAIPRFDSHLWQVPCPSDAQGTPLNPHPIPIPGGVSQTQHGRGDSLLQFYSSAWTVPTAPSPPFLMRPIQKACFSV